MTMPTAVTEVLSAVADIFHVNPLLAATWWLAAVVFAVILVYAWQRLAWHDGQHDVQPNRRQGIDK